MSPTALGVFRAERQGSIDLLVERAAAGEAPSSPCRRGRWPVGPGFTASCPSRTIGTRDDVAEPVAVPMLLYQTHRAVMRRVPPGSYSLRNEMQCRRGCQFDPSRP